MSLPKIVILGAGYGSLMTVKGLTKKWNQREAQITLVNQNSYHYITTILHEPAAGTIHHDYTRVAISSVINPNRVHFVQDRVTAIKLQEREVQLENGEPLPYDYLVVGLGSSPETFGIKGLLENAFFIRNIDSVRLIRQHIEYMFARYSTEKKEELITIVVGGAGFTGIEYVGELVDRIPEWCRDYDIPFAKVRIINIEAAPTILPGFDKELVAHAVKYLEKKGVIFNIGIPMEECTKEGVILKGGKEVKAATVVWTGGVRGNKVVEECGLETLRGRVKIDEYLRVPEDHRVFVVGDSSLVLNEEGGRPYPPTAQMATQQGQYLGKNLPILLREDTPPKPFQYMPKGLLASLGRKEAIGVIGKTKVTGPIAVFVKRCVELRWLYLLGGWSLVFRKGKL
jgi:NADH:ubiquinone reductase (H+-translocating)